MINELLHIASCVMYHECWDSWSCWKHGSHTSGQKEFKDFSRTFPDPTSDFSKHFNICWEKMFLSNILQKLTCQFWFDWVWSDCNSNNNHIMNSAEISRTHCRFSSFSRSHSVIQGLFHALKALNKIQGLFQTSSTAWEPCKKVPHYVNIPDYQYWKKKDRTTQTIWDEGSLFSYSLVV